MAGFFVLGNGHTFGEQHVDQANKRQADQAGGVVAFGALEEADSQAFCFKAAGAIVGLLGEQVAFDLFRGEGAHVYGEGYAVCLIVACLAVEQGQAGEKGYAGAAGVKKLLARLVKSVRFADDLSVERCHLVGADDQVLGMEGGKCPGFLQGQAFNQFDG